jgi:serine protease AprX
MRRGWALRLLLLCLLALALVGGSAAQAASGPGKAGSSSIYGPKVDPRVVAMAAAAADGESDLRLLVFGDDLAAAEQSTDAKVRRRLRRMGADGVELKVEHLLKLAGSAGVRYIAPDVPVVPTAASAPLSFPSLATQHPAVVGAQAAWSAGYTGEGIGIAVIDSGVAASSDFGSRLVGVQVDADSPAPADAVGHGSFVAAVAGGRSGDGRYVGIAPGATVYALNVARPDGVYSSDVVAAVDWVLANHRRHNIRVANLSLSESAPSSYLASVLDTAVERLWRDGVTVVVSAGNRGEGVASYAPANDPFVITVGATDTMGTVSTGDDRTSDFSSRGRTQDAFDKPELHAPGRRIVSLLPGGTSLAAQAPLQNLIAGGYASMSGTSFSAPQVAGAAAILLQKHPTWTPDQVKWVLQETGDSLSGGSGRMLDLAAALTFAGTPGSANQGVAASSFGLESSTGGFTAATWNAATWNAATWNAATWNAATWNAATWNSHLWE